MMGWTKIIAALASAALLSACQTVGGWFNTDDTLLEPAELVDFQPTRTLSAQWSVNTGAGIGRGRSSLRPLVAGDEIWVGDHQGRLTAISALDGRVVRQIETNIALSSGPSVAGQLILVGSYDGELLAYDRASGALRWRARLSSELLSFPVLHDGIVIARCIDGRAFGFDQADGQRVWIYDRGIPLLTLRGNSDPLVRAGQVFIGFDDGTVVALRVNDGTVMWTQQVSIPEGRTELERLADIDGPMTIVGSDLYVITYGGRIASLSTEAGRILWVRDVASYSGLSLGRTRLALSDREDTIWVIDRRNGSTLWQDESLARRQLTRPVFVADQLAVADQQGYLHLFDAESGQLTARARVGSAAPVAAPVIVGQNLLILDSDGKLSAWSLGS